MDNNKSRKISFIIPIRDRDNKRIQNCINSLKSDITGEIIIIDYGSENPIKDIDNAKIIRYDKNEVWNKSHAINLGIKESRYDFIGTVDCDIILSPDFFTKIKKHMNESSFIYTTNVRRIEIEDIIYDSGIVDFYSTCEKSFLWFNTTNRRTLIHNANGGVQIYPRAWAFKIGGADEALVYWGGTDNDMFERAIMNEMTTVNMNSVILHQEHEKKKEKHLSEEERRLAILTKIPKTEYLERMLRDGKFIRNDGIWGEEKPNQSRFIKIMEELRIERQKEKLKMKKYQQCFVQAVREGKDSFEFDGVEVKIYG